MVSNFKSDIMSLRVHFLRVYDALLWLKTEECLHINYINYELITYKALMVVFPIFVVKITEHLSYYIQLF